MQNLWVLFTGNGKGKTSAAVGTAIRASGYKRRTLFLQFVKIWPTGEKTALEGNEYITFLQMGGGFVGIWGDKKPRTEHKDLAQEAWAFAKEQIQTNAYDIVILDEIHVAIHEGLLDADEILPVLLARPDQMDLVTTGRYAPEQFIEYADTVTEFTEKKHPFQKGILAKRSIDF